VDIFLSYLSSKEMIEFMHPGLRYAWQGLIHAWFIIIIIIIIIRVSWMKLFFFFFCQYPYRCRLLCKYIGEAAKMYTPTKVEMYIGSFLMLRYDNGFDMIVIWIINLYLLVFVRSRTLHFL
jgi:hypothetical protein